MKSEEKEIKLEFSSLVIKLVLPVFIAVLINITAIMSIAYKEPTEQDIYDTVQTIMNYHFGLDTSLHYPINVYFAHLEGMLVKLDLKPIEARTVYLNINDPIEDEIISLTVDFDEQTIGFNFNLNGQDLLSMFPPQQRIIIRPNRALFLEYITSVEG